MRVRGTCLDALSPRSFNRSVQRDNPDLNVTFAAEAAIFRAERSNVPSVPRTPHVFASAFFVLLSRFFWQRFGWRSLSSWQPSVGRTSRFCRGWLRHRVLRLSALTGSVLPSHRRRAETRVTHLLPGAVSVRITQLSLSSRRMKGRTKFYFQAWRRRRRATGRRPSEARGRGRGREL